MAIKTDDSTDLLAAYQPPFKTSRVVIGQEFWDIKADIANLSLSPLQHTKVTTMTSADITKSGLEQPEAGKRHHSNQDEVDQSGDNIIRVDSVESGHVVKQQHEIYAQALAQYPTDDSIDPIQEKKIRRKLDRRIIPVLGVCYFFYYVDKTTLQVFIRQELTQPSIANQPTLAPMLPSSASNKISTFKETNTRGSRALSISAG
ncbi:hypothetical protein F66182_7624 [Fusarium sp. NRRL 66182]|nr:hypothetical protein F66182_7624 [Fusarium sp. NRRL 66182]